MKQLLLLRVLVIHFRHSDKRRGRRKGKKAKKSVGNDASYFIMNSGIEEDFVQIFIKVFLDSNLRNA